VPDGLASARQKQTGTPDPANSFSTTMASLRPDQILLMLKGDLDAWAPTCKATLGVLPKIRVAQEEWEMISLLCQSPQGFQIVLSWAGDKNTSETPRNGNIGLERISVVMSRNPGMSQQPSESVYVDKEHEASFLRLINAVRYRLLGCVFPTDDTENLMRFDTTEPVTTPEGVTLAAYRMFFEMHCAIPTPAIEDNEFREMSVPPEKLTLPPA
jgi:hypothetical protein